MLCTIVTHGTNQYALQQQQNLIPKHINVMFAYLLTENIYSIGVSDFRVSDFLCVWRATSLPWSHSLTIFIMAVSKWAIVHQIDEVLSHPLLFTSEHILLSYVEI